MSKQNLQTLLQRLGQTVGIADLALDDDGYCLLRLDGTLDIAVEFIEDAELVVLTARCGALGEQNREAVLQQIADANFYWAGTGGGTLSTNSREGMVYLHFRESTAHLDQARLENLLQALVLNSERWGARLAATSCAPAADTQAAPSPAVPGGLFANRA
ncbi:MAG TPA: type III secretion system chaperone [Bordetella sp.]|mgnify:CR=1 FL=1|uniref:type III secretion system chaperone n=1 Tax=Bordetella sp. TaxID=28081 RepID=UPI002ED48B62